MNSQQGIFIAVKFPVFCLKHLIQSIQFQMRDELGAHYSFNKFWNEQEIRHRPVILEDFTIKNDQLKSDILDEGWDKGYCESIRELSTSKREISYGSQYWD